MEPIFTAAAYTPQSRDLQNKINEGQALTFLNLNKKSHCMPSGPTDLMLLTLSKVNKEREEKLM